MTSDASFEAAAKHLFRHLHEPHVLRKNPLVSHFFEQRSPDGAGQISERSAVDRIHQLVREGAEHFRAADIAANQDERALRQHTIVVRQCLERRPIHDVAASLNISYRHCYRERAEIARRVARYICERSDDASALDYFPELDEFRCRLDRVVHSAQFTDKRTAFRNCDDLIRVAPSASEKIEALRVSAFTAMQFGDLSRASAAQAVAQTFVEDLDRMPSSSRDAAYASIDLIETRLAYCHADRAKAFRLAQRASSRLERARVNASPQVAELYVESLFELGSTFWNAGDAERGYDCLARAELNLRDVRIASFPLRTRITVVIWRLRNQLLMSSKSWFPASERLKGLASAFEQAYASGAFVEATDALVALTDYHASAGNDAETLRAAKAAMVLAKQQQSEQIRVHTAIQLAIKLLSTQYWEYGLELLPGDHELEVCDVYHREVMSYFAAERALRRRAFRDASALARIEGDHVSSPRLAVRRYLIAAVAASELGRQSDACRLIEAAVGVAEQLGSAVLLRDAYRVAARVTGDQRFKRQASDVGKLVIA